MNQLLFCGSKLREEKRVRRWKGFKEGEMKNSSIKSMLVAIFSLG